jgi:hypothetical protein
MQSPALVQQDFPPAALSAHHRTQQWQLVPQRLRCQGDPVTPSLPTIVKRLGRPILPGCITPPQPIAIDEGNPAQYPPIINALSTSAPGKERSEPHHLCFCQPIEITHLSPKSLGFVNHDNNSASSRLMGPEPRTCRPRGC